MSCLDETIIRVPWFNTIITVPEFGLSKHYLITTKENAEGQIDKMRKGIYKLEEAAKRGKPERVLDSWLFVVTMILNGLQMLNVPKCETDKPNEFIKAGVKELNNKLKRRSEGEEEKEGKDRKNEIVSKYLIVGGKSNVVLTIPELELPKYAFAPNEKYPKSQIDKMSEEVNELEEAAKSDNLIETRDEWFDVLTSALSGFQMINMSCEDAKSPSDFVIRGVKNYNKKLKRLDNELIHNGMFGENNRVSEFTIIRQKR